MGLSSSSLHFSQCLLARLESGKLSGLLCLHGCWPSDDDTCKLPLKPGLDPKAALGGRPWGLSDCYCTRAPVHPTDACAMTNNETDNMNCNDNEDDVNRCDAPQVEKQKAASGPDAKVLVCGSHAMASTRGRASVCM